MDMFDNPSGLVTKKSQGAGGMDPFEEVLARTQGGRRSSNQGGEDQP